jgi:D-alanyl-D-alanine carboxypeptidase (penicillin-binding protein 5/6)
MAVLIVVVLVAVRLITFKPPHLSLHVTVASTVRLSGSRPVPAWPGAGEAALDVPSIGSLGSGGGDTPLPTASLAKVMTAYLTLKKYPLTTTGNGFSLTVTSAEAQAEGQDTGQNESVVAVRAGEQLNERQLLEALLIPSGDNIAQILAAYTAGSVSRFVAEMNSTARSLDMDRTTYTDPSGFSATTVSVPADQIRVFEQAMRFSVFRQIVSMPNATLPVAGTVRNFDPILAEGYDGKTGSDSEAEGCLVFFKNVTVGGRRLTVVGAVMGQGFGSTTSVILGAAAAASERIVASVLPSIQPRTVVPAGAAVMAASSPDGGRVSAVTAEPLRVISWGGIQERLAFRLGSLGTDLLRGQRVGEVTLTKRLPTAAGDHERTVVHSARKLSAPGFFWRLGHLL